MIELINISGVRLDIDESTRKYVARKISRLDRHIPRNLREFASAEVILKEVNRVHGNKYEADVTIKLPGKTLVAKDSTVNILAAIDIVEANLVSQLQRYKKILSRRKNSRKILSLLSRGSYSSTKNS